MDLARAPRRAARKKGSGYENGSQAIQTGKLDGKVETENPNLVPRVRVRGWENPSLTEFHIKTSFSSETSFPS